MDLYAYITYLLTYLRNEIVYSSSSRVEKGDLMGKVNKTVCFDIEVVEFLKKQKNASEYLNSLVLKQIGNYPDLMNLPPDADKVVFCPKCNLKTSRAKDNCENPYCGAPLPAWLKLKQVIKDGINKL